MWVNSVESSSASNGASALTGLHFATTTLLTLVFGWLGYIRSSHLPPMEVVKFVIFANFSIVGMNVSLMWNSVGFYQIAKLSMIPVSCFLEVVLNQGFLAAFIGVCWSTALQQYEYSIGSFNLLGQTASVQAVSLIMVGPFLDYWLMNERIDAYHFTFTSPGPSIQMVLGMVLAVIGMVWYGNASSKPGGKERVGFPSPIRKNDNQHENQGLLIRTHIAHSLSFPLKTVWLTL